MILFRYLGTHACVTLEKARLKTSRVRDLNDPFEFLYSPKRSLTEAEAHLRIQNRLADPSCQASLRAVPNDSPDELRQKMTHPHVVQALISKQAELAEQGLTERLASADATIRLVCFSCEKASLQNEILLWSHYANKHKGHRIGFEIPKSPMNGCRIDPVEYSANRVEADFNGGTGDPKFLAAMVASIGTKNCVWEYEREFRLAIKPELCVPDEEAPQMEHFRFDPAWVVRVDCGLRSDPAEDARIAAVVKERYTHANVYKAKFHPTDYSIEYELVHL